VLQAESKKKHIVKKAREILKDELGEEIEIPGEMPDEDELRANDRALEMDMEAMHKLLESDDALKTAHDEIKRLNALMAQFEIRFHGIQNERNELIREVKRLQAENDKLKGRMSVMMDPPFLSLASFRLTLTRLYERALGRVIGSR